MSLMDNQEKFNQLVAEVLDGFEGFFDDTEVAAVLAVALFSHLNFIKNQDASTATLNYLASAVQEHVEIMMAGGGAGSPTKH
jgi:hypothetical protein